MTLRLCSGSSSQHSLAFIQARNNRYFHFHRPSVGLFKNKELFLTSQPKHQEQQSSDNSTLTLGTRGWPNNSYQRPFNWVTRKFWTIRWLNLPLMKYRVLSTLSLLKSMWSIFIVLSFSKSIQSWVPSPYKIKVSASATLRFNSGDLSRQSNVDDPRWNLLFKIGGQWTLSDPLMWATLNDKKERQSITIHFWLRELVMFTKVSGARGHTESFSSIATILFDAAMID